MTDARALFTDDGWDRVAVGKLAREAMSRIDWRVNDEYRRPE
jgi:hypothetical protein